MPATQWRCVHDVESHAKVARFDFRPLRGVTSYSRLERILRARVSHSRDATSDAKRPHEPVTPVHRRPAEMRPDLGAPREQADLPAEQPSSCEDPRLPSAHAHARWPCDSRGTSPQGPYRALCLRVLPPAHRLRRSPDFRAAVRRGARAGSATLVVHMLPASEDAGSIAVPTIGFVVSKQVGNAVQRNLVKRRLRGAARALVEDLPGGSTTVVRALPASASAEYADLKTDLDRCVQRTQRRVAAQ